MKIYSSHFPVCVHVCGEGGWWEHTRWDFTASRLPHVCYNCWRDWVLRGHQSRGYVCPGRLVCDSCPCFHHYWDWEGLLFSSQNSLWISNSPRVVLYSYWMWFSKTTLHFEFPSLSGSPPPHCFRGRGLSPSEDLANIRINLRTFPFWYMT